MDDSGFAPERTRTDSEDIPDNDFFILMNKEITKIEFDPSFDEKAVDIVWLQNEFSLCEQYQGDVEIMALDLRIEIFYDDGTSSILRFLNEDEAVLSIRYNDTSYRFRSESIAMSIQ